MKDLSPPLEVVQTSNLDQVPPESDIREDEFEVIKNKKNFTVAVRIKPEFATPSSNQISISIRKLSQQTEELRLGFDGKRHEYNTYGQSSEKKFVFDKVYDSETDNSQIFLSLIENKIQFLEKGVNLSIMAYGATNSGKTYTIFGKKQNQTKPVYGLSYLTFKKVYQIYHQYHDLSFSFVQIYNQNVYDLLNSNSVTNPLNVMQDSQGNTNAVGLSKIEVKSVGQLQNLINQGNQARVSSNNVHNMHSSRSHAFMEMQLKHKLTRQKTKIVIVDLAGSQKYIYNSTNGGILLKEGSNINKSLLSLGNCIKSLNQNDTHIPYRDSKLTRLLKQNLSGFAHNIMIACINKRVNNFEENMNSLNYASKAIRIQKQICRKVQSEQLSQYQCVNCQEKLPYSLIKQINKHEEHKKRVKTRQSQSLSISPIQKNVLEFLPFKSQSLNSVMKVSYKKLQKLVDEAFLNLMKKLQIAIKMPFDISDIIQNEKKVLKSEIKEHILTSKSKNKNKTIHQTSNKQIIVSEFQSPAADTLEFKSQQILSKEPPPKQRKLKISLSKPKKYLQNTAETSISTYSSKTIRLNQNTDKNQDKYPIQSHIKIQDEDFLNTEEIHSFRSNLTVQIHDDKDKILNQRKKVLEQMSYNQRKKNMQSMNLLKFKSTQNQLKNKTIENFINNQLPNSMSNKIHFQNKQNFIKIQDSTDEVQSFQDFIINQRLLDSTTVAPRMKRDEDEIGAWKNIFIKSIESPAKIDSNQKAGSQEESFVQQRVEDFGKTSQIKKVFRY